MNRPIAANQSKTNAMKHLLLTIPLMIAGCATNAPHCVLIKFPSQPSPETIFALAATQNENPAIVADWFNYGERGFILSSIHTNEISLAIQQGATIKEIK